MCVFALFFFFGGGRMFFTLHLVYFHPGSQPWQLLLSYFLGEEIVTQPSMTWPHAQTMQRGSGLRVCSDDWTVWQNRAAANELGPATENTVGQIAHMLNILTAWVDASWGVISVTAEVPQKPRDGWVTCFSKRRRDSRPQKWFSRCLQWVQKEPCVDFLMEWFVSMNRGTQWFMRHEHRFTRNWGSWELCSARLHEFLAFEMEQLYKIRRWAS